jgi:hypothetical protein
MMCVVGGRFGDHPGLHQGVWLGEIQDLGPFLLTPRERSPDLENRGAILRKLEELTSSGDAA